MKTTDIIDRISKSTFVYEQLPMEMQLGVPRPELIDGKLCLVFLPHKEEYGNGETRIYPSSFKLVYVFPFSHIVEFKNLYYCGKVKEGEPVCISDKKMLNNVIYHLEELYKEYDRVFTRVEETGKVTEIMVDKCREAFRAFVDENGLNEIYGCDNRNTETK